MEDWCQLIYFTRAPVAKLVLARDELCPSLQWSAHLQLHSLVSLAEWGAGGDGGGGE